MSRTPPATRDPTAKERETIEARLAELRKHFHEWTGYEGREYDLVGFFFYELGGSDCCRDVVARAAPFALGHELVTRARFKWVMLDFDHGSHFAVAHEMLPSPIDLETLENGQYNRTDYTQPPEPGETTHDSLRFILFLLAWREVFGPEAELPPGHPDDLDARFEFKGRHRPAWYASLAVQYGW